MLKRIIEDMLLAVEQQDDLDDLREVSLDLAARLVRVLGISTDEIWIPQTILFQFEQAFEKPADEPV